MADRKDLVSEEHHARTTRNSRSWRELELPVWAARVAIAALAAAISAFGLFSFSFGKGPAWGGQQPAGLTLTVVVGFALASLAAIRPSLGGDNRFKAFTGAVIVGLTLKDIDSFDGLVRALVAILVMLAVIAVVKFAADRWRNRSHQPKRRAAPAFATAALLVALALPLVAMVAQAGPALAQSGSGSDDAAACPLLDNVAVLLDNQPIAFEGPVREISIDEGTEVDIHLAHSGADEHVTVHISLKKTRPIPLPLALPELVYTGEVEPGSANEPASLRVERDGLFNLQEFVIVAQDEQVASGTVRAFSGIGTFEITAISSSGTRCSRNVDVRVMSEGWQTPDSLVSVGTALLGSGTLAGLAVSSPSKRRPLDPRRAPDEPAEPASDQPPLRPPPRISKIRAGSPANARTYSTDEPVPIKGETRLTIEFKPIGEDEDEVERHLAAGGVVRAEQATLLIKRKFSMATAVSGAPMLVGFVSVDTEVNDETTTLRLLVLDQEVLISRADKADDVVIDPNRTPQPDIVDLTDGHTTTEADR